MSDIEVIRAAHRGGKIKGHYVVMGLLHLWGWA
jgi:hypothetical protein